ncbi:MAG: membrane protein insertion efficiency factor YidD [Rickettsiaceae bacterium]|nr:membrane protein insertion efficiency factor YidD [Rickettsiaceae bacterium]
MTLVKYLAVKLIKFYQYIISPLIGNVCRFHPSCSNYAMQAIIKYGVIKGCYLSMKRILRCNPYNKIDNWQDYP